MKCGHTVIVAGGKIENSSAVRFLKTETYGCLIAADSGMEFLYQNKISPDVVIGDFDSVSEEAAAYYEQKETIRRIKLNPIKDDTDTEAAVHLAIELGAESITMLGATGTRMDHALANLSLLQIGIEKRVPITILDAHNRIRMTDSGIVIEKNRQYGTYVSLIPFHGDVTHLTLKGMKYPLTDYHMTSGNSLGVSNEIAAEEAEISFEAGMLLVIESKD